MQKIEVIGSTVDFFKEELDGVTLYHFDSSMCEPPHPMVNAMCGLELLDNDSKLVMINHKSPGGLYPKVENDFDFVEETLSDGKVKVVFSKKVDASNTTDFSQKSCDG